MYVRCIDGVVCQIRNGVHYLLFTDGAKKLMFLFATFRFATWFNFPFSVAGKETEVCFFDVILFTI
jgi:hypothetical protein